MDQKDSSWDVTDSSGLGLEKWSLGLMRTEKDSGCTSHVHRICEETSEHSVKESGLNKPNYHVPSALPLLIADLKPVVSCWGGGEASDAWLYGMHH